jgi:hypothetical protein
VCTQIVHCFNILTDVEETDKETKFMTLNRLDTTSFQKKWKHKVSIYSLV